MSIAAELRKRQMAAVPPGVATKSVFVSRAENALLWDVDGRRLIDFAAGVAVLNTGHRHPRVIAAVERQLSAFTHTCFHVAPYESYLELAEKLNEMAPGAFPKKTMFVTTGAEAVENAIKVARYYTKRAGVIAFAGAFHGRTHMGMALTGKVAPCKQGFGPFPSGIYHAPFPVPYRRVSTAQSLEELDRIFRVDIAPSEVAAFIVEPVQGEGGFNVAPFEFLQRLRRIADDHGILLISDEIQAGMGRTGRMFGIEHSGVIPDVITLAKGLAGGFPLAAVTGRAAVLDSVHVGGLGGTYAGNPIGIAAALAVLDVIRDEGLCERATHIGQTITSRIQRIAAITPRLGEVRGLGAMVALEIVKDARTREPDAAATAAILSFAEKRGLLLLSCGDAANVVRLLVPLTIPEALLDQGLEILCDSLTAVLGPDAQVEVPAAAAR